MIVYLFVVLFSFLIALVLTPAAKWLAFKFKFLDQPGTRKIHDKPIPLLGSLPILISFIIVSAIFAYQNSNILWILFFGIVFVLFGLIDDKGLSVRARIKIFSHLLFSFFFVYITGIHFNFFKLDVLNLLISACFITFMTNSMNMLDGMDGLVSGVSAIASFFFFILALNSGQTDLAIYSLAIMGACIGFLKYNFNPASIFLGEGGSTLLGFLMAFLAMSLNVLGLWDVALTLHLSRVQFISFLVPLIILGIPIFDTYFVFSNRFLHRIKFSQPGKDHSHHRIHLMGFSQKATVLTIYAVQFILGSVALSMVRADVQQFFALLAIVGVFFVGFSMFLLRVKVYS